MMGYSISVKAQEDLENIWSYTFRKWSKAQADRYLSLIFEEIEYLANNPESGRDFGHVKAHYRSSKVKSRVVFFRYSNDMKGIEVVRILHQNMDLENGLND